MCVSVCHIIGSFLSHYSTHVLGVSSELQFTEYRIVGHAFEIVLLVKNKVKNEY